MIKMAAKATRKFSQKFHDKNILTKREREWKEESSVLHRNHKNQGMIPKQIQRDNTHSHVIPQNTEETKTNIQEENQPYLEEKPSQNIEFEWCMELHHKVLHLKMAVLRVGIRCMDW